MLTEATQISIRLKQACRALLWRGMPTSEVAKVQTALALLDDVPDVAYRPGEPDPVFHRQNERFVEIYRFACMLLERQAADVRRGDVSTFSLLFNMDQVFERFIAAFVRAEVVPELGAEARPQGKGDRRPLFRDPKAERDVLNLKPDLLVTHGEKTLVLDTKWKRLSENKAARPSDPDLYQLYAYLHRYSCGRAILLYPARAGVVARDLEALRGKPGAKAGENAGTVGVSFVDVSRTLRTPQGKAELARELKGIIRRGLGLPEKEVPEKVSS